MNDMMPPPHITACHVTPAHAHASHGGRTLLCLQQARPDISREFEQARHVRSRARSLCHHSGTRARVPLDLQSAAGAPVAGTRGPGRGKLLQAALLCSLQVHAGRLFFCIARVIQSRTCSTESHCPDLPAITPTLTPCRLLLPPTPNAPP